MNRQLKFRVWHKKSKEWCGTIGLNESISQNELEYDTDDLVFVQYTGLKDSKGNEIYEGDIIHLKFGELNANLVVKWDEYMGLKYHNGGWTSLVHVNTHGEVIGNIFENPELPN